VGGVGGKKEVEGGVERKEEERVKWRSWKREWGGMLRERRECTGVQWVRRGEQVGEVKRGLWG